MAFDANELLPDGRTRGQVETEWQKWVDDANRTLETLGHRGCRWWFYSVSHRTFEIVIGDPNRSDNLVITLAACNHVTGPTEWPRQRLRVIRSKDVEAGGPQVFELEDESAGFKAVGNWFGWSRGYDLEKYGSRYMPRPPIPKEDAVNPDGR